MKKVYALIKKYPGSPEIGHKVYWNGVKYDDFPTGNSLYADQIENNPEFWKYISEFDYKILRVGYHQGIDRVISENGKLYLDRDEEKTVGKDRGITIKVLLNCLGPTQYYIKSVQRVIDDSIFTVGEVVIYHNELCILKNIYFNEHNQLSFEVYRVGKGPKSGTIASIHLNTTIAIGKLNNKIVKEYYDKMINNNLSILDIINNAEETSEIGVFQISISKLQQIIIRKNEDK